MEPDVLVRRVALVALPVLLLVGYLLRSREPDETAAPAPASASAAPAAQASGSVSEGIWEPPASPSAAAPRAFVDELPSALLRESPPPPPPQAPAPPPAPATPAVRLPEAQHEAPPPPSAPQGSPCGGLVVRLITMAEDPKFAFASLASGYGAQAEILHVGESIAGYRVTSIEWDRVWVQGKKGRCAIGMHLGAREAERDVQQTSAEQYAKLPWVLPYEITRGMFKRSEMDWELSEDAIARLYERGADVFAGLRVRGHRDGDEIVGLELHDVRLDSFLERLGILSGDVLLKIADRPVNNADDVKSALEAVREESELVVDLMRNGENYQLELRVQGSE